MNQNIHKAFRIFAFHLNKKNLVNTNPTNKSDFQSI